jgi:hypothetical protein
MRRRSHARCTKQEERRAEFHDTAERRYAGILVSGKTVSWKEMRRHLERRLSGGREKP